MVKHRVLFCNNSLGGNALRYLVPFYDVIFPIGHVSLTLDGVTSYYRVINVRNTCKHLRYSQTFGDDFFSAMAERWKNLKDTTVSVLLFHRFLCVRIEIALVREMLSNNSLFVSRCKQISFALVI